MPFMKTKLRMIGSGYGVLLPKKVIDNLRLSVGDELELIESECGHRAVASSTQTSPTRWRRSGGPKGSTGTAIAS